MSCVHVWFMTVCSIWREHFLKSNIHINGWINNVNLKQNYYQNVMLDILSVHLGFKYVNNEKYYWNTCTSVHFLFWIKFSVSIIFHENQLLESNNMWGRIVFDIGVAIKVNYKSNILQKYINTHFQPSIYEGPSF